MIDQDRDGVIGLDDLKEIYASLGKILNNKKILNINLYTAYAYIDNI